MHNVALMLMLKTLRSFHTINIPPFLSLSPSLSQASDVGSEKLFSPTASKGRPCAILFIFFYAFLDCSLSLRAICANAHRKPVRWPPASVEPRCRSNGPPPPPVSQRWRPYAFRRRRLRRHMTTYRTLLIALQC